MSAEEPKCSCCHLRQKTLYCPACLHEGINLHNEALKDIQAQINALITRSTFTIDSPSVSSHTRTPQLHKLNDWRRLRAEVAEKEQRCCGLRERIAERERAIGNSRNVKASGNIAKRRSNLRAVPSSEPRIRFAIQHCQSEQHATAYHIINARRVLVQEAVAVFGLNKRPKGEWAIAGIVLPAPDAFRLYPSTHINAAISHVIHLLTLVTSYLSITLPFTPIPQPPFESKHIGRPLMKANTPFVSTTKWRDKNVLWMSSTASVVSKGKSRNSLSASKILPQSNMSALLANSIAKHRQFLTSFALLSYSVSYLAWSQGVQGIGIREEEEYREESDEETAQRSQPVNPNTILISATSILELIHSLSVSPGLGQRAHEPGTNKVVRHLGFGLDVAKVVQNVISAEEHRWGTKQGEGSGEDLSEGWDLLDPEPS
uniref:Autophagy-related protein 14 n=1 Tax=Kwoniella pini CBS 10737 TaxID=1296096 RepID=A0A1B9I6J2_9TREE|nr:uncharacterized protein I206_03210 [Kwoniella pini CBS 10737]OCF51144.1 hypothetical protein I206_03210 [Kwoniella pini CBS 10737]